jgi:hypothetical protein
LLLLLLLLLVPCFTDHVTITLAAGVPLLCCLASDQRH